MNVEYTMLVVGTCVIVLYAVVLILDYIANRK